MAGKNYEDDMCCLHLIAYSFLLFQMHTFLSFSFKMLIMTFSSSACGSDEEDGGDDDDDGECVVILIIIDMVEIMIVLICMKVRRNVTALLLEFTLI